MKLEHNPRITRKVSNRNNFYVNNPKASNAEIIEDTKKKLYELEIQNKDNKIMTLENELKDYGLDNSKLLQIVGILRNQEIISRQIKSKRG